MIWLLLACGAPDSGDLVRDALSTGGDLASCAEIPFAELAITCRVQVAAQAGRAGDKALTEQACAEIPQGLWRDECHFRAGEELGKAGFTDKALRHCARAGDYARNCVTHTAWGLPPVPDLDPADAARVNSAMSEAEAIFATGLEGAAPGVKGEGMDTLMAQAWFNLYLGSGSADPSAARAADSPDARSAFALEAVRLLYPPGADASAALAQVRAVYSGAAEAPSGARLDKRLGRFKPPILTEATRSRRHAMLFGGGVRIVGPDAETDLDIATLEALFFRESTQHPAFAAYLDDPREEVAWTATKLYALTAPEDEVEALAARVDPIRQEYIRMARTKR